MIIVTILHDKYHSVSNSIDSICNLRYYMTVTGYGNGYGNGYGYGYKKDIK